MGEAILGGVQLVSSTTRTLAIGEWLVILLLVLLCVRIAWGIFTSGKSR